MGFSSIINEMQNSFSNIFDALKLYYSGNEMTTIRTITKLSKGIMTRKNNLDQKLNTRTQSKRIKLENNQSTTEKILSSVKIENNNIPNGVPSKTMSKKSKIDGTKSIRTESNMNTASQATTIKSFKPPNNWRDDYEMMVAIRGERNAPVDSMGASALGDRNGEFEFHTLVALMLSSQTKDQVVASAMENLKNHGLTLNNIYQTSPEELNKLISQVGFHNRKTTYIKEAVRIIVEEQNGKVPDTLEGLVALPGVGPKMAILVLHVAFDKHDIGIAIDTHMHRFCNVLKWAKSNNPEGTRQQLESWLPREYWKDVNLIMVGLGQMIQQPESREKMLKFCGTWDKPRYDAAMRLLKRLGLKV